MDKRESGEGDSDSDERMAWENAIKSYLKSPSETSSVCLCGLVQPSEGASIIGDYAGGETGAIS